MSPRRGTLGGLIQQAPDNAPLPCLPHLRTPEVRSPEVAKT